MRQINPRINDPIKMLGLGYYEALYLLVSMVGVIMILGFLNVYFDFMSIYVFFGVLLLYAILYQLLKRANAQKRNDFLRSWISFHFTQPKHIKYWRTRPGRKHLI